MAEPILPNPSTLPPTWNHPVLPGNAVQGMILLTKGDFVEPPQSTEDFMWILMENVLGVHDIRLRYNDAENKYTVQKSKGHMNNDGTWIEEWETVGTIVGISEEAEEALENFTYVRYEFESTTTSLLVKGLRRDGAYDVLCNITFATQTYVDQAITNLNNTLRTYVDQEVAEGVTEAKGYTDSVTDAMKTKTKTVNVVLADGTYEQITFLIP